jgi:hypothetical protein
MAKQITDPIATIARSLAELEQDSTLSETARNYAEIVQRELGRLGTIARQTLAPYEV